MEYSKLANFQVFPLHELPALEKLQRTWVRAFLSPQPLDDICKYFGVKITMYFAWLGHYTTALIVPAAVGAIYWVKKNYTSICIKSTADLLIAMIVFFFYSSLTSPLANLHRSASSAGIKRSKT